MDEMKLSKDTAGCMLGVATGSWCFGSVAFFPEIKHFIAVGDLPPVE
jgi:hypothetical protein